MDSRDSGTDTKRLRRTLNLGDQPAVKKVETPHKG